MKPSQKKRHEDSSGRQPRLLIPFTGGDLDQQVLDAAIRIARVENAILVPVYLLVVPLEFAPDAPLKGQVEVAVPLLEAVELAASHVGITVDARIERGRSATHALQNLWEVESFERIVVPAPTPGRPGFSPKELAWMLTNAPSETLILRPAPEVALPPSAVSAGIQDAASRGLGAVR